MQPQQTIGYKTYIKRALVQGLRTAFANHPDLTLRDTKVVHEFSFDEVDYPAIVIRYHGRDNLQAGVGHVEHRRIPETDSWIQVRRRLYHGTAEFEIHALSTLDRDLLHDSLVHILGMPKANAWAYGLFLRVYDPLSWATAAGVVDTFGDAYLYNFLNLNNDIISELPESQVPAPWGPEDVLLYSGGASLPVMGEILSVPPQATWTTVQSVGLYPYIADVEPVPTGTADPAVWIPDTMSY